jgi:excisionase family DNA binding protein
VDDEYDDQVLTAEEAAELLRVSVQTVLKESRLGVIPGVKIGREWRYSRRALIRHLRQYAPAVDPDERADQPAVAPGGDGAVGEPG